ncbi:hypothetical protein [Nocardia sp. IFM 10818]
MTRKSRKKKRTRTRMAARATNYTTAARSTQNASAPTPSAEDAIDGTVLVINGRQYRLDSDLMDLRCVATTVRGARCRNPIEIYGQVAKWDHHGRYRLDWESRTTFWLDRYGTAERLAKTYVRQRCIKHLGTDAPDHTPPELHDIGVLVPTPLDILDTIRMRAYEGLITLGRHEKLLTPVDLTDEVTAAAAGDLDPLLARVALTPLPPARLDPDTDYGNTTLWLHLLQAHHHRMLTIDQIARLLAVSEQNAAYRIIGRSIDLGSITHLQAVLYDELSLTPRADGNHATDTDFLTELHRDTGHPFLEHLLGYRHATIRGTRP